MTVSTIKVNSSIVEITSGSPRSLILRQIESKCQAANNCIIKPMLKLDFAPPLLCPANSLLGRAQTKIEICPAAKTKRYAYCSFKTSMGATFEAAAAD